MKYSQISIIRTSIIRGFWDQILVRPSTVDNRGLTVVCFEIERERERKRVCSDRERVFGELERGVCKDGEEER